jgi:hypothetical protein
VDMHATDLVAINGITRVLSVDSCQQGVYPRGHVLPLRLPHGRILKQMAMTSIKILPPYLSGKTEGNHENLSKNGPSPGLDVNYGLPHMKTIC